MQAMSGPEFEGELAARAREAMRLHRKWYLVEGVVLIVLGLLAVLVPQVATLAITVLVGWLFVIGGAIRVAATFSRRASPGFWMSLLTGILALVLGFVLLFQPFAGALTLTMVLVVLFLVQGTMSIMIALQFRRYGRRQRRLDDRVRRRRHPARPHHPVRLARHRRLGDRPARRHQPDLPRPGDRDDGGGGGAARLTLRESGQAYARRPFFGSFVA